MYERLSTSAWATRPPTGVSTARASSDSSIPCQSSTSSSTVIPERSPTASWQAAMRFATALRRRWWASGRSSPLGPPGETPLVRGPEYGERVLCLVAEVPGYVLKILHLLHHPRAEPHGGEKRGARGSPTASSSLRQRSSGASLLATVRLGARVMQEV